MEISEDESFEALVSFQNSAVSTCFSLEQLSKVTDTDFE